MTSPATFVTQSTESVQYTATEAAIAKLSCTRLGYYTDPYLAAGLCTKHERRSPLINRGYFTRVYTITSILRDFLQLCSIHGTPAQVISLGAGNDTLYWQIKDQYKLPFSHWWDVDFAQSIRKKAKIIERQSLLRDVCEEAQAATDSSSGSQQVHSDASASSSSSSSPRMHYPDYSLVAADLRDVKQLDAGIRQSTHFNPSLPTVILSECVFTYLTPEHGNTVLQWITSTFDQPLFLDYAPLHPETPFGRTMIENLHERGCDLLAYQQFPTIDAYTQRYAEVGLSGGFAGLNMRQIYERYVPAEERQRVERLEMFDEYEEWHLMMEHYHISVGWKNGSSSAVDSGQLKFAQLYEQLQQQSASSISTS